MGQRFLALMNRFAVCLAMVLGVAAWSAATAWAQVEPRLELALSQAEDAILDDRLEAAAKVLDALLSEQRDNMSAWTLRAVVSERAGNIIGALQSAHEAHLLYEALDADEPYIELRILSKRLMVALAAPDAAEKAAASLPIWTWPPRALLSQPLVTPAPEADAGKTAASPAKPTPGPIPAVAPAVAIVSTVTIVPGSEIDEGGILGDPHGQWAVSATASSEYGKDRYNAAQATGAPNVASYSDNPKAWCHSGANSKLEWLEVGFAQPVNATELRVRQNFTPGTIARVEAFAADGRAQVLWEGTDPNSYPSRQIAWFVLRFPATSFPVQRVKLTLNTAPIRGWKQIDAVQLVGDAP